MPQASGPCSKELSRILNRIRRHFPAIDPIRLTQFEAESDRQLVAMACLHDASWQAQRATSVVVLWIGPTSPIKRMRGNP